MRTIKPSLPMICICSFVFHKNDQYGSDIFSWMKFMSGHQVHRRAFAMGSHFLVVGISGKETRLGVHPFLDIWYCLMRLLDVLDQFHPISVVWVWKWCIKDQRWDSRGHGDMDCHSSGKLCKPTQALSCIRAWIPSVLISKIASFDHYLRSQELLDQEGRDGRWISQHSLSMFILFVGCSPG